MRSKSVAGHGSSSERCISVTLVDPLQPFPRGIDRGRRDVGGGDVVAAGREQSGQHSDRTAGLECVPVPWMRQQRHRDRELALLVPPILQLPRVGRRPRTSDRSTHRVVARSSEPSRKASEFGEIAFGVALPHVHGQIGDPRARAWRRRPAVPAPALVRCGRSPPPPPFPPPPWSAARSTPLARRGPADPRRSGVPRTTASPRRLSARHRPHRGAPACAGRRTRGRPARTAARRPPAPRRASRRSPRRRRARTRAGRGSRQGRRRQRRARR